MPHNATSSHLTAQLLQNDPAIRICNVTVAALAALSCVLQHPATSQRIIQPTASTTQQATGEAAAQLEGLCLQAS
jgi:hypothetical protein